MKNGCDTVSVGAGGGGIASGVADTSADSGPSPKEFVALTL